MEIIWYHCSDCEYKSKRKFDVKRHSNAKHLKNKIKEDKIIEDVENKLLDDILDDLIEELKNEPILTETNDNETKKELHYCSKCNKSYKGTKYLVEHEKKCIGVNKLTCPKCMKMFTSYGNKFNHIKRNTCKARSVIHGINNTSNNTVININNITNNNNTVINNINIINNFGSERTDYITHDDIISIFINSGNSIIPKYIEMKHFNKNFPENNNIKYEKNNNCLIKRNNEWKFINIDYLSDRLLNHNSAELDNYYTKYYNDIDNSIKNVELLEFIYKRLNYLDLTFNKKLFSNLKDEVKYIIKSNIIL